MSRLSTLLKKYEAVTREIAQLESDRAAIKAQILDENGGAKSKSRRKRSTRTEAIEDIKATVKVLRDANTPLPRREIAARLKIPTHAVSYRLAKAVKMRFVESVGSGRYRATNIVPAF
jgi:hypothetical protein